jgi:hypothetical protein
MSRRFTVTAERGRGNWWVTECAEVGAISQVRRLDQVADDIRDAIAYLTGLDESDVDIDMVPVLPEGYRHHRESAQASAAAAAKARRQAAEESRQAAQVLRSGGLSVRDIGTVMGISYQRAAQLARNS